MDTFKCCICGKEVNEWGNDPWPVDMHPDHKCCNACDMSVVLAARLRSMAKHKEKKND